MKKVVLINTPTLPCPDSHYLHTRKFLDGFKHYGYEYHEIKNIQQTEEYPNTPDTIFYISDHGVNEQEKAKSEIEILSKFTNPTFLLWHLHHQLYWLKTKLNKWILTGEHLRKRPLLPGHAKAYDIQLTLNNYVPLTFAANIHPNEIQENNNPKTHDCFYVGQFYNVDWRRPIMEAFPNSYICYTPPYISETERVTNFATSFASLGFQATANKQNFVITERIFEAMMYGCLILVDSPFIINEMPDIVTYVENPNDIIKTVTHYKQHPNETAAKIKNGYDYLKKCGTYYHTCGNFINKMKELNYI